jgi:asparagine synthase (glutamine-hydrolysing)
VDEEFDGFLVLPDTPDVNAVNVCRDLFRNPHSVSHASGRPWLLWWGNLEEITVVNRGSLRLAVVGSCSFTAARLSDMVGDPRSVEELDSLVTRLPGCIHLIASVDGQVRVQGSASGLRQVFHTRVNGVAVAAGRADLLASLTAAEIDEEALALQVVCAHGKLPPPLSERSMWRDVSAVPADSHLTLDTHGVARERRWWQPPRPEVGLTQGAARVRQALEEAVAARRPRAGRLSMDMSGGLDSTSLVFLAVRGHPVPLTLRWGDAQPGFDDARYANQAIQALPDADHLVLDHQGLPDTFDRLGDVVSVEEPYVLARTLARARHTVAVLAQRGSRMHVAGHGGDELFMTSMAYLHTLFRQRPLTALPRLHEHRLTGRWRLGPTLRALADTTDVAAWWRVQAAHLSAPTTHRNAPQLGWGLPLRAPAWVTSSTIDTARGVLLAVAERAEPLAVDRGQHNTLATLRSSAAIYRQLRRLFHQGGLRLELPYLDDRVIEAVLSVRLTERVTPGRYKPLLAEAVRGVLPEPIRTRTTKGEASDDIRIGLRRHMPDILAVVEDPLLAQRGLIDPDVVRAQVRHPQTAGTSLFALECLLGCETWLRAVTTRAPERRTHEPAVQV